jgi:L,D-transpeptidase catalytic domain
MLLVLALTGCGGHAKTAGGKTPTHATGPKKHPSKTPPAKTTTQSSPAQSSYPKAFPLGNDAVAHWAVVEQPVVAHKQPSLSSAALTTLSTTTGDGTSNLVLVIGEVDKTPKETWFRVRLPILPNNSVGYVQSTSLSRLYTVFTHLYVDLSTMTATLKQNGVTIFSTRVGVGKSQWPTPPGQYYIRDELTDFNDPFYGPIAFGTSARSAVLTDWPGGGYVGVHGTNEPDIIPGQVSHGCIRMKNSAIEQLARLMPVGTPLTIT